MRREPVDSSAIKSIGYDEDKEVVEVEIRETGKIYKYYDVPLEDYLALIEADSIGSYYNKVFKLEFTNYEEVNK